MTNLTFCTKNIVYVVTDIADILEMILADFATISLLPSSLLFSLSWFASLVLLLEADSVPFRIGMSLFHSI